MDFLDRLRILMEIGNDNNSSLAKKSGIPYTTIDGLFKRGWEKAQISTIQKICSYYNVSLDYMIYGANGLSDDSTMLAGKFDTLTDAGKEFIQSAMDIAVKTFVKKEETHQSGVALDDIPLKQTGIINGVPLFDLNHDSVLHAKEMARTELNELNADVQSAIKE